MAKRDEISQSDIGKRVTIRLHDNPGYRDIVGILLNPTSLKNRHGEVIEFDPAKIFIWREINEVPRTATSGAPLSVRINELERIMNKTWQANEQIEVGNWLFRADVGISRRANSALALGNENHIDELINWYRARNLQPAVSLVPLLAPDLDFELERRGFENFLDVHVMVKDASDENSDPDFEITDKPSNQWLAIHDDQKIERLLTASPAKYLTLGKSGTVLAIGRVAFADGWAVISRIWVEPTKRGIGLGRKLLSALESQAQGAKLALQVNTKNEVAIELYKSAGYVIHHTYRIRALSPQINLSHDAPH